jgi:hypothetical protein
LRTFNAGWDDIMDAEAMFFDDAAFAPPDLSTGAETSGKGS